MSKTKLSTIALSLFFVFFFFGYSQAKSIIKPVFEKVYDSFEDINSVAVDKDGYLIICGTYSDDRSGYVAKINSTDGEIVWVYYLKNSPTFSNVDFTSSNTVSEYYDVIVDDQGNYYAAGGLNYWDYNVFLITKFDSSGQIIWEKTYGGIPRPENNEELTYYNYLLAQSFDRNGSLWAVGQADTSTSTGSILLQIDPQTGNELWRLPLYWRRFYKMVFDENDYLVLAGYSYDPDNGDYIVNLTKFSISSKTISWQEDYAIWGKGATAYDIKIDQDGSYVVTGGERNATTLGIEGYVPFIMKISSDGQILQSNHFDQALRLVNLLITDEGNYIVTVDGNNSFNESILTHGIYELGANFSNINWAYGDVADWFVVWANHWILSDLSQIAPKDYVLVYSYSQATIFRFRVEQEVQMGDVDADGKLSVIDALLVARYALGLSQKQLDPSVADLNCDGKVNIIDALYIARMALGFSISNTCK